MCRIIDQNIKKCLFDSLDFQNFPGEHAHRNARASPSQWLLRDHSLRPRLHEDDVKTIATKSYLSGKKSFRIGLLFTRRRSVSANFWRRYEDDRKSGNFWRRYGNDRPSSSCKHHIRIDRSGSYQIVIAMRWPRTQASQSCINIFSARVGYSYWRVRLFSESIPSFEARSWQGVAIRHKEEQRRAAASLLILLIVAQALLLLLFKALYTVAHLQVTRNEAQPERRAALAIKLKFSTERKGNNFFRLSFWLSSSCRHVRLSQFILFLGSMYLFSSHFLFVKCF